MREVREERGEEGAIVTKVGKGWCGLDLSFLFLYCFYLLIFIYLFLFLSFSLQLLVKRWIEEVLEIEITEEVGDALADGVC